MGGWWAAQAWEQGPIYLGSWVFWVIGSIVLHELAHGWAAIWQGDRTPIHAGHMTVNPLVHMGPWSLLAFALVGLAWGQMPVDPSRFRSRYGDAYVSIAGPAMNLVLALGCIIGAALWFTLGRNVPDPVGNNVWVFLFTGAWLNALLMLFNMIPVPPLDGSRVLGSFYPPFERIWQGEAGAVANIVLFMLLFMFAGSVLFPLAQGLVGNLLGVVLSVMPGVSTGNQGP